MKFVRTLLTIAFGLFFIVACGKDNTPTDEEQGAVMLVQARQAYQSGDYSASRDTILSLRKRFPLAIEARKQAILLLDSVELMDAEGDSLKQEFFRRKLQHDLSRK